MIIQFRMFSFLIIAPIIVMNIGFGRLDRTDLIERLWVPNEGSSKVSAAYTDTSYASLKLEIGSLKSSLNRHSLSEDSISSLFASLLVDEIIPHWLGTPWSFEGHTSIPGSGEIACGYFVSTTLKDMGFNLDRYKLAQQLPINEAKSLALGKPLLEINSNSTNERITILRETLKEGIYFIGFDQSHVGYIQKREASFS